MTAPREPKLDIARDESALRDALAALDYFDDPTERAELAEKIQTIRRRLPDRGAGVDGELAKGIRFERGTSRSTDPAGSRRISRINQDAPTEDESYPRGPRNGAVVAAALAAVMLVAGG